MAQDDKKAKGGSKAPSSGSKASAAKASAAPDIIQLDRFSPALITWAAHRLAANNAAAYRARFGISLMEWRVLLHLVAEPGATATYLAQTIGYNKATISRTVDTLHQRGLVDETLNPADARSSHLFATTRGLALYHQILPVALSQERLLLANLSPTEAETFIDLMTRVVEALRDGGPGRARRKPPPEAAIRRLQRRAEARGQSDD